VLDNDKVRTSAINFNHRFSFNALLNISNEIKKRQIKKTIKRGREGKGREGKTITN